MADRRSIDDSIERLDVTVVLVNEGYISTAVGPIEVFASAGAMWGGNVRTEPPAAFPGDDGIH